MRGATRFVRRRPRLIESLQPTLQGVGKIVERKPFRDKDYTQTWLYVPTKVAHSRSFPFHRYDEVLIIVDEKKKRMIVEKLEPRTV